MTQLAITVALIAIVYYIGYAIGRKEAFDDVRQMSKELEGIANADNKGDNSNT